MTDALLAALEARANSRGLVLIRQAVLLANLRIDGKVLGTALESLSSSGAVEILSGREFLVVRLRKLSGKEPDRKKAAAKTAAEPARAYSFQSSLSESKQLKDSYRQQPADEALLSEILETLGESDPTTFRGAIRRYSPATIRTVLDRVRRMPKIRKNRTALFRYLLPRIAKESPSTK